MNPPPGSPAESAELATPASATSKVEATPASATSKVEAAPEVPALPLGWWRGPYICLELFTNGDFELSVHGSAPKVLIFGAARLTPNGPDAFSVELTVARIWKGRYVSACRRSHQTGGWADRQEALDVTFTPGSAATLTLRRAADDAIELCGARCETLRREVPALGGRWRRAGFADPRRPDPAWSADELLEIDLTPHSSHVWSRGEGVQPITAYGEAVVTSLGDDRFRVVFTPKYFADLPPGTKPSLFGAALTPEQPRTLAVRRLAGQAIAACDGARCATLERQFDAFDYEVK